METFLCFAIPIIVIVVFFWLRINQRAEVGRRINAARSAYDAALRELREHPTDPERKVRALELGRAYSALTRENKAVTIFDEMALGNDISAATAGATAPAAAPATAPAAPVLSTRQRLQELAELKDSGAITEDEYQARRKAILDAI